jgi:hypothetical protein
MSDVDETPFSNEEAIQFAESELKRQQIKQLRATIAQSAGDAHSLLGTTADATQLLLYVVATLITKHYTANSLAEVREAAAPFNDLLAAFLAKIESGEVKLPFQVKGMEVAVSDIETRATAVAEVLQSVTHGGN